MPTNPNKRRCTAMAAWTGQRCRKWALRKGERALCALHAQGAFPGPEERRCTATTMGGRRCSNWTMLPEEGEGEALRLCNVHAGEINHRPPRERRCTAMKTDGQRCRRWTTKGDKKHPALCYAHAYPEEGNLLRHGFYRRLPSFSEEEREKIEEYAEKDQPLFAEVFVVRLKVRELLEYLERPNLTPAEHREAIRLAIGASLAVADLLAGIKRIDRERTGFARELVAHTVQEEAGNGKDG